LRHNGTTKGGNSRVRLIPRRLTQPIFELKLAMRLGRASRWRSRIQRDGLVVVGITGSHGKSTTSALLGKLLATLGPAQVQPHNNAVRGVAQNVLATRPHHDFLVQEVGFYVAGSVKRSADILRPTVAVVTASGGDHRKAVGGSLERTAEEKGKLVEALPPDGLVVLNADDSLVAPMAKLRPAGRVVFFGRSEKADLRLLDAAGDWPDRLSLRLAYRGAEWSLDTRFVSPVNALAVMAATLTALELGVSPAACQATVGAFEPLFDKMSAHRGLHGEWYVLDATKGSFQGLSACLDFIGPARAPRKTVVFGTLADYAGASRSAYQKAARMALGVADRVFFTGAHALRPRRLAAGEFAGRLFMEEDPARMLAELRKDIVPGELIYVKAALVDRLAETMAAALAGGEDIPPRIRRTAAASRRP
jgi:UDP-N-acetylmuramoyl-tripeptide--D-alanyl-D-alanine ligase